MRGERVPKGYAACDECYGKGYYLLKEGDDPWKRVPCPCCADEREARRVPRPAPSPRKRGKGR